MNGKIAVVRPEFIVKFPVAEVEGDGSVKLEQLQKAVGGYVERVLAIEEFEERNLEIYVDEEGKLKRRPPNPAATWISQVCQYGDVIVGNAVIVKNIGEDVLPLFDEDIEFVKNWYERHCGPIVKMGE